MKTKVLFSFLLLLLATLSLTLQTLAAHGLASECLPTGFAMTVPVPNDLTLLRGSHGDSDMGLFSCGFAGTVILSASISPALKRSPSITVNPSSVIISPSQGFVHVVLTITTFQSTRLGNYTAMVTATGGTQTSFVILTITVVREPHTV